MTALGLDLSPASGCQVSWRWVVHCCRSASGSGYPAWLDWIATRTHLLKKENDLSKNLMHYPCSAAGLLVVDFIAVVRCLLLVVVLALANWLSPRGHQ